MYLKLRLFIIILNQF